jgi:hypothetical protein
MIKALLLIFNPVGTWDQILSNRRHLLFIFALYLMPLLLLTCAAEGWGLVHWGKMQGEIMPHLRLFSPGEAVVYQAAQLLASVLIVFVGAKLVQSLGETFHGRHTYVQAFTTVAYGLSPLFLFRLLDALPKMSPWLSWAIGIILSIGVLYHGVPRVMQPDPPHAFGLFLMSCLLLVAGTGLFRFVTAWYLAGKLPKLETAVSTLATKLGF